eukprot:2490701-Amphidinium_carterae.1
METIGFHQAVFVRPCNGSPKLIACTCGLGAALLTESKNNILRSHAGYGNCFHDRSQFKVYMCHHHSTGHRNANGTCSQSVQSLESLRKVTRVGAGHVLIRESSSPLPLLASFAPE